MALCKVMIIGNLGSDPEMRYTPTNRAVTQFNVAVNQSTKNQQTGEWVEETDWFRVSVWGDRAERMAESLRKGNRVFVEGRFKTRQFEGRDGQLALVPGARAGLAARLDLGALGQVAAEAVDLLVVDGDGLVRAERAHLAAAAVTIEVVALA